MLPLLPSTSLAYLWSAQISLHVGVPRNLCHRKRLREAMLLLDTSVLQAHTRLTQFFVKYGSDILSAAYGDFFLLIAFSYKCDWFCLQFVFPFGSCKALFMLETYRCESELNDSRQLLDVDYPWHCYVLIILHVPSIISLHRTLVFQNARSAFQTDILSSIILF